MKASIYRSFGKRVIDLSCAITLLMLLSPLLLLVTVAVRIFHGGPVLYQQKRTGYRGQTFVIRKFRTMTNARDDEGNLLSDELRLTRFGRLLRSSSLDELPELWNVVLGQMSLVGPRPLLPQYLELYSAEQARRHEVLPGITGLAQVRGRNSISWEQRFEYDVQYVNELSLRLDCQVLIETVRCVFQRDGISSEGHATCPAFEGSGQDAITSVREAA